MSTRVERVSKLPASAEAVWARAVSPEGVNHELGPWLRMTIPHRLRGMSIEQAPLGETLGRSWVLLFGVLPVDWDDLRLVELEPGRRFLERSSLMSMRRWQHERIIEPGAAGCTVTDRLEFEPRGALAAIPGGEALARRLVAGIFRHRHRRLARWVGSG